MIGVARLSGVFVLTLAMASVACSPEASRARGGSLGADVGNTRLPIELHGNVSRNNPSFGVPEVGRAPDDATGLRAWWEQ